MVGSCPQDNSTFNTGFGPCASYAAGQINHQYCGYDGAVAECPVACNEFTGAPGAGLSLEPGALLSSVQSIGSQVDGNYGPVDLLDVNNEVVAQVSFVIASGTVSAATVEPQVAIAGQGLSVNDVLTAGGVTFALQAPALIYVPSVIGTVCNSTGCPAWANSVCALANPGVDTSVACDCGMYAVCTVAGAQCMTQNNVLGMPQACSLVYLG